jgi:hypothetical protein
MLKLIGQSPAPGEKNNPVDSDISFFIKSDEYGIKLNSIIIKVNGEVAFVNGSFKNNFSESTIEFINLDLSVVLNRSYNFSLDEIVTVEVTASNLRNKRFNEKYVFYIDKSTPVLIDTNLNTKITENSIFYLEFADSNYNIDPSTLSISIDENKVITNGQFESFFNNLGSSIVNSDTLVVKIDHPEFFRNSKYNLKYSISNSAGNTEVGMLKFEVDIQKVIFPDAFPMSGFVGPTKGIMFARNVGIGDSIEVESPDILPRSNKSEVFYLIYYNNGNKDFFGYEPKVITSNKTILINGLKPNDQLYWAVRCLESYKGVFDFAGMESVDNGYLIPNPTSVFAEFDSDALVLYSDSTDGYPDKGLLVIGQTEVVRYESINRYENYFVISQRGLNNTSKGIFISGDEVKLFLKCQDSNDNVIMGTPTYEDGYQTDREYAGTGFVVTDYQDQDAKFFQGFDFCGYHQALPDRVLQGIDDCGSYLGGEFNGSRGFNIYDRMLNREEVILDQVGEPVVLLKRKWDGLTCDCVTSRRGKPKARTCNKCYGTGFVGGYDQFINRRRQDKLMMMSFPDTVEDLKLDPKSHLEQVYEPSCWTLPIPTIRDRDVIVRFDFSGDQEFFYEVLNVSREKIMYKHFGRQKVSLKRLDKTDLIYHFNYIINT